MIGLRPETPNSSNNLTVQVTSAAAGAIALYSDSGDDLEMVIYFLDFQAMGELPKSKTYHMIDLLDSGQGAQSKSEKACKVRLSKDCNKIPCPLE